MSTQKKSLIHPKASKKADVAAKSSKAPAGKGIQSARALNSKRAPSFRLAVNHNLSVL